jgi:hypothetical protein
MSSHRLPTKKRAQLDSSPPCARWLCLPHVRAPNPHSCWWRTCPALPCVPLVELMLMMLRGRAAPDAACSALAASRSSGTSACSSLNGAVTCTSSMACHCLSAILCMTPSQVYPARGCAHSCSCAGGSTCAAGCSPGGAACPGLAAPTTALCRMPTATANLRC